MLPTKRIKHGPHCAIRFGILLLFAFATVDSDCKSCRVFVPLACRGVRQAGIYQVLHIPQLHVHNRFLNTNSSTII